ncbi:hypothetical protein [Azospirillum brasilense]|uniref:hypothetical protein n=1 Tax=Azospirillum brasilense TaxID=192 RepID=UPI00157B30A7|nr:hypothetical protein [Azospirillum brasilense]
MRLVDVVNGRRVIVTQPYIGIPVLLASACLPTNVRSVQIVNPFRRTDLMLPRSAWGIQDRLSKIIFNASLMLETGGVHTINSVLRQKTQTPPFRARDRILHSRC